MPMVLAAFELPVSMTVVWLVAAVIFAVTEAVTMGITAIWFSAGSLAAMVVAMLGAPLGLQIAIFIVVSGVVLYFTRGWAKKFINNKAEKTNSDRIVGMSGLVTEPISNEHARGQIKVNGQIWTARSANEDAVEEGAHVRVVSIQGVKAIVERE